MNKLKGCGVAVAAFFVIVFIIGSNASGPVAESVADVSESSSPSTPVKTNSPLETLNIELAERLGDLNRDGTRLNLVDYDSKSKELMVKFSLNDNFSNDSIVRGAWRDMADTISAIRASNLKVKTLYVFGSMPFQDDLGNPIGERDIIGATFEERAIVGANLDNLPGTMLENATADNWLNPQFSD